MAVHITHSKTVKTGKLRLAAVLLASALLLGGCGGRKIVLTAGVGNNEVFTVEDKIARDYELRIYLTTLQNEYENRFGEDVWDRNEGLAETVRQNALARLSKVKALNLMAEEKGILLSDMENAAAMRMAEAFYGSLSDAEKEYFGCEQEDIAGMYREYSLAMRMYREITGSVDTEISDDEARSVRIQCILIKTWKNGENGERIEYSPEEKADARQRAEAIHKEIFDGMANNTGVTFDTYISRYNEEGNGNYTIGRGEVDEAFEAAAFAAVPGKIGDVVETADGYRIIKGISTYDRNETDRNKEEIAQKKQEDAYVEQFNGFIQDLDYHLDDHAFAKITMTEDPSIDSADFFLVYESFGSISTPVQ